jgi:hypothetical protein
MTGSPWRRGNCRYKDQGSVARDPPDTGKTGNLSRYLHAIIPSELNFWRGLDLVFELEVVKFRQMNHVPDKR